MLKQVIFGGHSAVLFDTTIGTVAIDPWLYENPSTPESLKNLTSLELICLTHGHLDHAGNAVRLAKQFGASICATWELAMIMIKEGVPENQVIPMNKGGSINYKGIDVSLTNAFHSSTYDMSDGSVAYAGEACGVVVRDQTNSIYHAGDTCLFGDMLLIGNIFKPNIAFLPIGDRFTMDPKQAAIAANILGCKLASPIHYNTFPMLTGTAEEFSKECQQVGVECLLLEPGQGYNL